MKEIKGYCEYGSREILEQIVTKAKAAGVVVEENIDMDGYVPFVGIWFDGELTMSNCGVNYLGEKMSPEQFLAQIETPKELIIEELNSLYKDVIEGKFFGYETGVVSSAISIINKHLPI